MVHRSWNISRSIFLLTLWCMVRKVDRTVFKAERTVERVRR
jgi:hypothetical protein